jgi:hypothetical protein
MIMYKIIFAIRTLKTRTCTILSLVKENMQKKQTFLLCQTVNQGFIFICYFC